MIHAKNYEKVAKFFKVMAKILLVPFSGHGVAMCKSLFLYLIFMPKFL